MFYLIKVLLLSVNIVTIFWEFNHMFSFGFLLYHDRPNFSNFQVHHSLIEQSYTHSFRMIENRDNILHHDMFVFRLPNNAKEFTYSLFSQFIYLSLIFFFFFFNRFIILVLKSGGESSINHCYNRYGWQLK